MTPEELLAWNRGKLPELRGDALAVAMHVVSTWPEVQITSAARDYKDQARAMAQNACARRDNPKTPPDDRLKWIVDTYTPSVVAIGLQTWFEQHPHASEPDVVAAFTRIMSGAHPADLKHISKHIVIREREEGDDEGAICINDLAEAVDFAPPRIDATEDELKVDAELCAYLHEQAQLRGGRFLEKEGGLVRRHWQAK